MISKTEITKTKKLTQTNIYIFKILKIKKIHNINFSSKKINHPFSEKNDA
jgi:hypothetical protein